MSQQPSIDDTSSFNDWINQLIDGYVTAQLPAPVMVDRITDNLPFKFHEQVLRAGVSIRVTARLKTRGAVPDRSQTRADGTFPRVHEMQLSLDGMAEIEAARAAADTAEAEQ
jgi:hypothetical protein